MDVGIAVVTRFGVGLRVGLRLRFGIGCVWVSFRSVFIEFAVIE